MPGQKTHPLERERAALRVGTCVERRVVTVGISELNQRSRWATELECGHVVKLRHRPRLGATMVCEICARMLATAEQDR